MPEVMAVIYSVPTLVKWCAARLTARDKEKMNRLVLCDVIFLGCLHGGRAYWVQGTQLSFIIPASLQTARLALTLFAVRTGFAIRKMAQRLF